MILREPRYNYLVLNLVQDVSQGKATYGVGTVLYEVTKRRKSEEYGSLNASVSTIFPGMEHTSVQPILRDLDIQWF